jgi:hypothetical protein
MCIFSSLIICFIHEVYISLQMISLLPPLTGIIHILFVAAYKFIWFMCLYMPTLISLLSMLFPPRSKISWGMQ